MSPHLTSPPPLLKALSAEKELQALCGGESAGGGSRISLQSTGGDSAAGSFSELALLDDLDETAGSMRTSDFASPPGSPESPEPLGSVCTRL